MFSAILWGKQSYPILQREKLRLGESRYLSHLPRSCLKEKSGSRTPLEQDATLTGAGRDPRALPTRQRGTETQSGKAAALMRILVSPHPRVIQPPTPCRSPHLQQSPKHLKIEHVVLRLPVSTEKSSRSPYLRQVSMATAIRRLVRHIRKCLFTFLHHPGLR